VIPNAHYYKRGSYDLKQIVKYAKNRDFTSMIVVNEDRKYPSMFSSFPWSKSLSAL
jgi:ribosome production factor 1